MSGDDEDKPAMVSTGDVGAAGDRAEEPPAPEAETEPAADPQVPKRGQDPPKAPREPLSDLAHGDDVAATIGFSPLEEPRRRRSGGWRSTPGRRSSTTRDRDASGIAWDIRDRDARIAYVIGRAARRAEACARRLAYRVASALASSDLVVVECDDGTALEALPSVAELLERLDPGPPASADAVVYLMRVRDDRFRPYDEDETLRLSAALARRNARLVVDVLLDAVDLHPKVRRRESVYAAPWGEAWLEHVCEHWRLPPDALDDASRRDFLATTDWRKTPHARETAIHRACLEAERDIAEASDLAKLVRDILAAPNLQAKREKEQEEIIDAVMTGSDPGLHRGHIGAVILIVAAFAEAVSAPDFDELCRRLLPDGEAHPAALPPDLAHRYEVTRADAERLERDTPPPPSWRDVHAAAADDIRSKLDLVVDGRGVVRLGPAWSPDLLRQRLRSRHAGRLDRVLATIGDSGLLTEVGGRLFAAVSTLPVAAGEATGTRYEEHLARALKPASGRVPVEVLARLYPGVPVELLLELVKLRDWAEFAAEEGDDPHARALRAALEQIAPGLSGKALEAQRDRITDEALLWTARVLAQLQKEDRRAGRSPELSAAVFAAMERTDGSGLSVEPELYAGLLSAFLCVAPSSSAQDAAGRLRRLVGANRSAETAKRDRMQTLRVMEKWLVQGLLFNREASPADALPMTNWLALTENPNGRVEAAVAGWVRDEMIARATSWPNGKGGTPWLVRLVCDRRAPHETEAVAETATAAFLDWLATPTEAQGEDLSVFLNCARAPEGAMEHKKARMAWRLGSIRETLIGGLSETDAAETSPDARRHVRHAVDEQLCAALGLPRASRLEDLARPLVEPEGGGERRPRLMALFGLVRTAALAQLRLRGFDEIVPRGTPERERLEDLIGCLRARGEPFVAEHARGLGQLAEAARRAARTARGYGARKSADVFEKRAERLSVFAQALSRGPSAVPAKTS